MATPPRMDDRLSAGGLSLDGDAYLSPEFVYGTDVERFVPADDLPLVDWIRANVDGIRSSPRRPGTTTRGPAGSPGSPGCPTPIGWRYHQSQQRRTYGASLEPRIAAMTDLYTTTDVHVMANVLSRYTVRYLVFGTQERLLASPAEHGGAALVRVLERGDRRRPLDGGRRGQRRTVRCGCRRTCVTRLRPRLPPPPPTP